MNYLLWISIAVLLAVLQVTDSQQVKGKATSEELCKHSFHSFLCNAPKISGRRRVYNGQIQGPPPPPVQNVLEGANSFPEGSRLRPDKPKDPVQPNLIPDTSNVFKAEAYLPPRGAPPPLPDRTYLGDNSNFQSQALLPPREKTTPKPTPRPTTTRQTRPPTFPSTTRATVAPYVRPPTTPRTRDGSSLLEENRYLPPVQKVPPPPTKRPVPPAKKPVYDPDIQPDGAQNPSISLRPDDSQKSHDCKHAFHSFLCNQPSAGSKRRNYNGQRQGPPQQTPNVLGQNSFLQPSKLLPPTSPPLFADNSFLQSANIKPNTNTYLPPLRTTKYVPPTTQTTRYVPRTTQKPPPPPPRYVPPTTQKPLPPPPRYVPPTTQKPPPPPPRYVPPTTQKPPPPPPPPRYVPPTTTKPVQKNNAYLPPKVEKPEPNLIGGNSFLDTSRLPPPTPPPAVKKPPPRPDPDIDPDAAQSPNVQIRPDQPEKKNNCGHSFHSFLCDQPKAGGRRRTYDGKKPASVPQSPNFIGANSFPDPARVAPPSQPKPAKVAPTPPPYPVKVAPPRVDPPLVPQPAKTAPQYLKPTTSAPLFADNSFLQETQLRPRDNAYLPPPPPVTPNKRPPKPKEDLSTNVNLFGDDSFLDPTQLRLPTEKPIRAPVRKQPSFDPAPQPDESQSSASHSFHSFLYQKPRSGGRRIYNGQRPSRSPRSADSLIAHSRRVPRQVSNSVAPPGDHDHHHDDHHGDHHDAHGDHHHDHHHHHHNITLEQLCRDPFHAFLCDPVDTSRRQIYDGEPYTPAKRGRSKGKLFGASSIIQAKRVRPEPNSLNSGITNPKENSNPEVQIFLKEQKVTQNTPSLYQSTTENVPSFYQSTTENVPSFYQSSTQRASTFYQSSTKNTPTFHQSTTRKDPNFYQSPTQNTQNVYRSTTQTTQGFYQSTTQNIPTFYQSTTQKVPSFVLEESNNQQNTRKNNPRENINTNPPILIGNQQPLGRVPTANISPSTQHSSGLAQQDLNSLEGIRNALISEKVVEPIENVKPQNVAELVRNSEPHTDSPQIVLQPVSVRRPQQFREPQSNFAPVARQQQRNVYRQPKVIDSNQESELRSSQQVSAERPQHRPLRRRRPKPRPVSDEYRTPNDGGDSRETTTHVPIHRSRYFHSLHKWQDGDTVRTFGEKIRQRRLPQGEKSLPDLTPDPVSPAGFARGPRGINSWHLTSNENVGEREKREEKRVFTGQGRASEPEEVSVSTANRDEKHVQKIERRRRPTTTTTEKVAVSVKSVKGEKKEEKRIFTGQGSISPPEDDEEEKPKRSTTTEDPQVVYQRGIDEEQKRRKDEEINRKEELKRREEEQKRRDEEDKRRAASATKPKDSKGKTTEDPLVAHKKAIEEEQKRRDADLVAREEEQKRRDEEETRREEELERRKMQEVLVEKELERRKIQQKQVDEELERRKEERERTMIELERRKKIKELEDD